MAEIDNWLSLGVSPHNAAFGDNGARYDVLGSQPDRRAQAASVILAVAHVEYLFYTDFADDKEMIMSQNAAQRLYLMQVGVMPEYQIPIVCYLVQTDDGRNILIDSGLPEILPEGETDFANGRDVIEQLASLGLEPADIDTVISTHYDGDHAGRHAAFTQARYVVQRVHHLDAASNPRFAAIRPQWDQPMERIRLVDGDTELLPGLALIETSGHVPGHQSVLVRLPKTGAILLTIDAVPFGEGFTRDAPDDGSNPDAAAIRASTIKLLDLVEREQIGLVIFGHDQAQWETLKKAPEFYE